MSAAVERAMLGIAADLLAQGRLLHMVSAVAMAVALALAASGAAPLGPALALSLLAGAAETVLALRTGFDAGLLGRLAAGLDLEDFDAGMTALGLMRVPKTGRPIAARIAGARRLLAWQAATLLLQAGCLGAVALAPSAAAA